VKPPLFGLIDRSVDVFPDVAYATAYMEAPEVEAGEWRLFDSEGVEFRLGVKNELDVVVSEEPIGQDAGFLLSQLRECLAWVPKAKRRIALPDIAVATLPELVAEFSRLELKPEKKS